MTPTFPQYALFANYIDAWKLGLQQGTASAPWSDRNDDVFLQGALGLISIELPDLRQPCALVDGQCPAVRQRWGITDDLGVRPSDHNWLRATVALY